MGLLTNEIKITLHSKTITYYKERGYDIPKRIDKYGNLRVKEGETLIVNTLDLPPNSKYVVKVRCDCCGKIYTMRYASYYRCNKIHKDIVYCKNCAPSKLLNGTNSPHWNENLKDCDRNVSRHYPEYKILLRKVLARDKSECQVCHTKGKIIHHIDSYDWCLSSRLDETNCICLCSNCHKNFHSIYGYGGNTKLQFEEWLGHTLPKLEKYNGALSSCRPIFCIEDNYIYSSASEFKEKTKLKNSRIYDCCNKKSKSLHGKHYLWYDEYKQMSNDDITDYLKWCNTIEYKTLRGGKNKLAKPVVCLTTKEYFSCIRYAEEKYSLKIGKSKIGQVCAGKRDYVGKLKDGTPLKWMFYNDYIEKYNTDVGLIKYNKGGIECQSI